MNYEHGDREWHPGNLITSWKASPAPPQGLPLPLAHPSPGPPSNDASGILFSSVEAAVAAADQTAFAVFTENGPGVPLANLPR